MNSIRRWLINLGLAAVGIGVALGIVEIAFALFPQWRPGTTKFLAGMGDLFVAQRGMTARPPDPYQLLSAYYIRWGEDGFRVPARTAERYDVLALGDSYTEAANVGYPWPDVLAEKSGLTVRNLGFRGYGPFDQARIMEKFGAKAGAQFVIETHFAGNDFSDAMFAETYRQEYVSPAAERAEILKTQPAVDEALWEPGDTPFKYPLQVEMSGQRHDVVFMEAFLWWLNIERETFDQSDNLRVIQESWQRIVDAAGDACVIISYFPSKEQIYAPYILPEQRAVLLQNAFVVTADPGGPFYISFDLPAGTWEEVVSRLDNQRDSVAALAGKMGLPFADLTPAFKEAAARGEMLYYTYDTHWNQAGHDLAGQLLADFIAANPCGS